MNIKSYAESVGRKPFNWLSWLEHVRFNVGTERMQEVRGWAGEWPTCACGNQCAALPRTRGGMPIDAALMDLGLYFLRQLMAMNYAHKFGHFLDFEIRRRNALSVFRQIENRSTELLKQLGIPQ